MNEEETFRRSDWYQSEDRGSPQEVNASLPTEAAATAAPPHASIGASRHYTDPYWQEDGAVKKARNRNTIKVIMACLFVLLLIVASAFIFSQSKEPQPGQAGTDGDFGAFLPEGWDQEKGPEDYGDYQEFFDNYYTEDDSSTGENSVPRAPVGTGVTLPFSPTDTEVLSLQRIYEKCSPSVVAITAEVDDESFYWGSGIVMTADGYILTNTHMLDDVYKITVTLYNDDEYDALVVGYDAISDIAVLKIDALGLTPAEFADSSSLKVGDKVVAIGNPLGEEFRGTMTDGIISAINRGISYNNHTMTLLQTNAAINEGNSGGPLINMAGQVVGLTNMKMMSYYSSIEGIGFAIPTATLKPIADALIETGTISGRPALGITVGSVPQSASDYYELPEGLYITKVSDGSDAKAQGIQVGDIVTAVNGRQVTTTSEVSAIKDGMQVGETLTLTIYRSGKTFDVTIALVDAGDIS